MPKTKRHFENYPSNSILGDNIKAIIKREYGIRELKNVPTSYYILGDSGKRIQITFFGNNSFSMGYVTEKEYLAEMKLPWMGGY